MSLFDDPISWNAPARLKRAGEPSNRTFAWIGATTHYGTVAGVVRQFMATPCEQRGALEMVTEAGAIGGLPATVFANDMLSILARRADLPRA
ncbi:MAG: hypothetical protein NW223_23040 [Hyphomicrobiaceae bacterium]|nr:hypothetical protein [Hyphomicrobiaceae bacterium]